MELYLAFKALNNTSRCVSTRASSSFPLLSLLLAPSTRPIFVANSSTSEEIYKCRRWIPIESTTTMLVFLYTRIPTMPSS